MASSTPLREIEENFLLCSICTELLNEPKQLPCLHRYCRDCLLTFITESRKESRDTKIKCPMCRQTCTIPKDLADGFKTDFHMKSIIEFIQLQKTFEKGELKRCISCEQTKSAKAYCFKCKHFLCDKCYVFHTQNPMFDDHQPHILNLESIQAQNLTLDKLASLTEDPRCQVHVKQQAQLCCTECLNIPVCLACTYGKHKGHDLHDVTELAKSERAALDQKLAELSKYGENLYQIKETINTTSCKLKDNVTKQTKKLIRQHKRQTTKINKKIQENEHLRTRHLKDIEIRRKVETDETDIKEQKELQKVKQKYSEIRRNMKIKYDEESKSLEKSCHNIKMEFCKDLRKVNVDLEQLEAQNQKIAVQNHVGLTKQLELCEQIIQRYKNLEATSLSILASQDDWMDVRCIPDIKQACEPLKMEMQREWGDLKSLSACANGDITQVVPDDVTICDGSGSVINVEDIKPSLWNITSITSIADNKIVIAGRNTYSLSYIAISDLKGKRLRQDKMKADDTDANYPDRFCCSFSKDKVATVCMSNEIGLYDVRDGSYQKRKVPNLPVRIYVTCIAKAIAEKHIIVGTNSREVYVLNDQLNYIHGITLPDVVKVTRDITVQNGENLLVCDDHEKRAFAVAIKATTCKLLHEFTKPGLYDGDWEPISVCIDKKGFIYILWNAIISRESKCIVAQYSRDGRQLFSEKPVNKNASCMTVVQEQGEEKLVIATRSLGELHTFDLVVS